MRLKYSLSLTGWSILLASALVSASSHVMMPSHPGKQDCRGQQGQCAHIIDSHDAASSVCWMRRPIQAMTGTAMLLPIALYRGLSGA